MKDRIYLLSLVFLCTVTAISPSFGKDPLAEANTLYGKKDYAGAAAAFRSVIATEPDLPTKAKAIFNLGLTLKQLHQYDDAIKVFSDLITQPINDKEPGGHLMEPYRNYRPRAQWEIGNCYFEQARYAEALQAYQNTKEKYPFQSWCGNEQASQRHRYAYQSGLCHEYLGETGAAIECYLDAGGSTSNARPHLRLVEIYAEAGQMDRLNVLLDDMDQQYWEDIRAKAKKTNPSVSEETLRQYRPTIAMRREIELRKMARDGQRGELIKLLKIRRSVTGPPDDAGNWEAIRAAQLLATTPEESTAEVLKSLNENSANERWAAFALALCGTDDAVSWIRERVRTEENSWAARSFIYCLSLAGDKGKAAIAQLEPNAKGNLKWAIESYRKDNLRIEIEFPKYPAVKSNQALPDSVKR